MPWSYTATHYRRNTCSFAFGQKAATFRYCLLAVSSGVSLPRPRGLGQRHHSRTLWLFAQMQMSMYFFYSELWCNSMCHGVTPQLTIEEIHAHLHLGKKPPLFGIVCLLLVRECRCQGPEALVSDTIPERCGFAQMQMSMYFFYSELWCNSMCHGVTPQLTIENTCSFAFGQKAATFRYCLLAVSSGVSLPRPRGLGQRHHSRTLWLCPNANEHVFLL